MQLAAMFISDIHLSLTTQHRFEFLVPKEWKNSNAKPVYIHLAGTGDHVRS